jgi:hypothetical protein
MNKIFRKKTAAMLIAANMLGAISCQEKFLEIPPAGQINEAALTTVKGAEGLLIGAYASLNGKGVNDWHAGATNWLWGSIRGGDANKGTDAGDFSSMNPIQRFELDATNGDVSAKWQGCYEGVARTNILLSVLANAKDASEADRTRISAEARFLRAHYYFELKKNFNNAPWVDETMTNAEAVKIQNNTDLWPKIEADFQYAFDNLPETQAQIGRANKWAAGAYLAKVFLYQKKWAEAKGLFDQVIANGKTSGGKKYGLFPRFSGVFRGANENSEESVFAFQAAVGTGNVLNTNTEFAMNMPYNTGGKGPGECCGFYAPSFDLASSYRTTATGLPLLDESYRQPANELKNDMGVLSREPHTPDPGPVDPRLDNTIGRRGVMFLDWQAHPGANWIRDQRHAGPYTQKKYSYQVAEKGSYQDGSSWTPGYQGTNFMIIRFADVLLMAAEAEIELGNLQKGLEYINQVRNRAANPADFVKGKITGYNKNDKGETDYSSPILDMTQDAVTYAIAPYTAFASKEEATAALRFERKLELALEGQRFYDLVRWGVAEQELTEYFAYEIPKLGLQFSGSRFTAGKHEYLPIPQRQIDLQSKEVLQQNPGY